MMSFQIKLFCILLTIIYDATLCSELKKINKVRRSVPNKTSILDTGKGAIGIFLNQSVRNLQPLRKHYHWRIHHNFHNTEYVLQDVHVLPKDITLCDIGTEQFCPVGSTALCTKNSAVRCLTNLWDTEICDNSIFSHCANIYLPCDKYTPECRIGSKNYFNVMLGCISIVNVYANLVFKNGTMAAGDLTKTYPPKFFCETVLAMPAKLNKGEEVYSKTSDMFGQFAVKVLGIDRR